MNFTLQFTAEELNIIYAGLNELPSKMSRSLLNKIDVEYNKQKEEKI